MDADLLYESTFLSATALFENLLERFLVEMVCGERGRTKGHYALVRPRNREVFRTLFRKNGQYADLLPYKKMVDVAKVYLNNGNPFALLDETDRDLLAQASKIRNAIAHKSEKALREFKKDVPGVSLLPPNRRIPGVFLKGVFRHDPVQKRIDLYLNAYVGVLRKIVAWW